MKRNLRLSTFTLLLALFSNLVSAQHFTPVWTVNPQTWMNIIPSSYTLDGITLEDGDEIAVFDVNSSGEEICVGVQVLPETPLAIEAGQESSSGAGDGFVDGHTIIYRYWDASEKMETTVISANYTVISPPDFVDEYLGDASAVVELTGLSHTWTGTTDDDWHDGTNWNSAVAPNKYAYVKIPVSPSGGNFPTLSGAGECENLQLKANTSSVGSLMDDGHLTVHGTATVQTYLTNSAGAGSFHLHLIGPTVDEENYDGGGTGAFLSDFNIVDGSTYAFEYDEETGDWVPLETLSTEIRTGKGIALSTTDDTDHTLSMTGDLMTGSISTPTLNTGGTNYEMISNPYPSAVNFPALATANNSLVENKYWIWNPAGGNYVARAGTTGATPYIQVGQGFFVETKSSGAFVFTNTERAHSDTTAFLKNEEMNVLTAVVSGGDYGFKDEIYITFSENATVGYDAHIEAVKWYSAYNDATMIYSIAEDDSHLAINVLPLESLGNENISVPFNFHCGYEADYTLDFTGLESFDNTEIWLEDAQNSESWFDLNQNPVYTFIGSPEDEIERFIIHFYGPTGINDFETRGDISISANRQTIFLVNNSDETIKNVSVYDISGRLIMQKDNLTRKSNTLQLNENPGYYIVKVITDQSTYSNKVLISAN